MTVLCLCFSPLCIFLSVFDVLRNPAFGYNVFWETDERKWFIHQTKVSDTNPSWPADHMVDIAERPRGRCSPTFIRTFSGAWYIGHHLPGSDSVWQQTQAGLTAQNTHIAPHNSNVQPHKKLQEWRWDMRVGQICQRGNYFQQRGNIDLASGVCLSISTESLWVNVSHQNSVEIDIVCLYIQYICSSKLLGFRWTGNFRSRVREDEWNCPRCWKGHMKTTGLILCNTITYCIWASLGKDL